MTEADATRQIMDALAIYHNPDHGRDRYNTPWRPDADGGTLSVQPDAAYGLGIKWYDHKDGAAGNGFTLAQRLGIHINGQKIDATDTPFRSLADYAHAHGCPVEVFQRAGWSQVQRAGHVAFAFTTAGGVRYRYADPVASKRKYDSDRGYHNCWYGLERAAGMAEGLGAPLILCNGEASTIAAQHHGVPACCVTGGEKGSLTGGLLSALREAWQGPIRIAYDCDLTGRKAARALAIFLREAGYDCQAIDLRGENGYDLADFCRLHNGTSADEVLTLPPLMEPRNEVVQLTPAELAHLRPAEPKTCLRPLTGDELLATNAPPPRVFVPSLIRAGLSFFIGQPGVGKTPALVQLAIAYATGGVWLGAFRVPKLKCAYIGPEYDQSDIRQIVIASVGENTALPDLLVFTIENFRSPESEEEALALIDTLVRDFGVQAIVIDLFTGFLPPEKFKPNAYRGDYREFLAYHRKALELQIPITGAWHGTKRDTNPSTMYNGGQGFWGAAGGGRLVMYADDEDQVKLYGQLRGNKAITYTLTEVHTNGLHYWSVVEGAEQEPALNSDVHRAIWRALRQHAGVGNPLPPSAIAAILKSDHPDVSAGINYVRRALAILAKREIIRQVGIGYCLPRDNAQARDRSVNDDHRDSDVQDDRDDRDDRGVRGATFDSPSFPKRSSMIASAPIDDRPSQASGSDNRGGDHRDHLLSAIIDDHDDFWFSVPPGQRTVVRGYLRGNKESDQIRARELCEGYGLDYDEARRLVRGEGA